MRNRILFNTTDLSQNANNWHSGTDTINLTTSDYIYIGQNLPFNHMYVRLGTANTTASALSVDIWDGSTWRAAVDVIDGTSTGGATLGQDGFIEFTPSRLTAWGKEDTEYITGLTTLNIYDKYWVRLSVSVNIDAGTTLAWMGNIFSNDNDLSVEYPQLLASSMKTAFEAGKTTWDDQHYAAAQIIIDDMIARKIIIGSGQIIDRRSLKYPAVSKVAHLAFSPFGEDYEYDRSKAAKDYLERMGRDNFLVDLSNDARLDSSEMEQNQGSLSRWSAK